MESISRAEKFELGNVYRGAGEVKGLKFELVKREVDLCIFKRSDGYFEVINLLQRKAKTAIIGGVKINFKEKESYPTGDSWNGACVFELERAEKIFKNKQQRA